GGSGRTEGIWRAVAPSPNVKASRRARQCDRLSWPLSGGPFGGAHLPLHGLEPSAPRVHQDLRDQRLLQWRTRLAVSPRCHPDGRPDAVLGAGTEAAAAVGARARNPRTHVLLHDRGVTNARHRIDVRW